MNKKKEIKGMITLRFVWTNDSPSGEESFFNEAHFDKGVAIEFPKMKGTMMMERFRTNTELYIVSWRVISENMLSV